MTFVGREKYKGKSTLEREREREREREGGGGGGEGERGREAKRGLVTSEILGYRRRVHAVFVEIYACLLSLMKHGHMTPLHI